MVEIGNYAKYYSVNGFLKKVIDEDIFVSKLSNNYARVGYGELEQGQINAWKDCYHVLREILNQFSDSNKKKLNIIFEFVLPKNAPWTKRYQKEKHVRADVILLSKNKVIVLEFKQRAKWYQQASNQAGKYERKLRKFHVASQGMDITTILVLTLASQYIEIKDDIVVCSPDMLATEIKKALGKNIEPCNVNEWIGKGFIKEKSQMHN